MAYLQIQIPSTDKPKRYLKKGVLSIVERKQIERQLKLGIPPPTIAISLGRSVSLIQRDILRWTLDGSYNAKYAQKESYFSIYGRSNKSSHKNTTFQKVQKKVAKIEQQIAAMVQQLDIIFDTLKEIR